MVAVTCENSVQYLRSESGWLGGRAEGWAEGQALSGGEAPLSPTPPAVRLDCRLE